MLILVLLAACDESANPAVGPRDTAEADRDTGANSDTDTAGDTGTDTGALTEHPCADYFGFHPTEALFAYDYVSDFGLAGTVTRQLVGVVGNEVTVEQVDEYTWDDGSGDTESFMHTWTYQCDESGVALVSINGTGESVYGGIAQPHTLEARYDPPALLIPADLAPGSEWTTSYKGTEKYDGEGSRVNTRYTWSAREETTLSLPAGDFTVLYIDGQGNGEDLSGDLWLDASVGLVQSQYDTLTSY